MSYFEAQAASFTPPPAPHFQTNLVLPELNTPVIAAVEAAINAAPPLSKIPIIPFCGAVTRVPVSDMAFALRQKGYELDIRCRWSTPAQKSVAVTWVKTLNDKLKPFASGLYVTRQANEAQTWRSWHTDRTMLG